MEKEYPTWVIRESRPNPDEKDSWEFILWENPAYQPFTIEYDGKVWSRQVVAGSTYIDDELIHEKDIELYMEVTEYENQKELLEVIGFCYPDGDNVFEALEMFCEERRDGKRVLKDLEDLTPDQLAKVQKYIYEGKPTLKLAAPKNAKK